MKVSPRPIPTQLLRRIVQWISQSLAAAHAASWVLLRQQLLPLSLQLLFDHQLLRSPLGCAPSGLTAGNGQTAEK
jgi:hypothetical protein